MHLQWYGLVFLTHVTLNAKVIYKYVHVSVRAVPSKNTSHERCYFVRKLLLSYSNICCCKRKRAFSCFIGVDMTRKHLFIRRIHVFSVKQDKRPCLFWRAQAFFDADLEFSIVLGLPESNYSLCAAFPNAWAAFPNAFAILHTLCMCTGSVCGHISSACVFWQHTTVVYSTLPHNSILTLSCHPCRMCAQNTCVRALSYVSAMLYHTLSTLLWRHSCFFTRLRYV